MQLDYVVRIDTDLRSVSWATVSENDLRYNCFLGDVILTDGIVDLSARGGGSVSTTSHSPCSWSWRISRTRGRQR